MENVKTGSMKKGKLYLIPTVISEETENIVITQQVKEVIGSLDYFLVENVRTARRYISGLKLGLAIENLQFELLDKNTKDEELQNLMKPISKERNIGIISESGCPGIADPGAKAVDFAHKHKAQVIPLSGPSSIFMALMASGFSGQSFVFHGYLPIDKQERTRKIKEMESDASKKLQTQIFMDTPYRNESLLQDLLNVCATQTKLSIARDITGKRELIQTRAIKDWKNTKLELNKIPVVFCLFC